MGNTVTGTAATDRLLQYSSVLGATGIGLGAMGAHALQKKLVERGMLDAWRTASQYHLLHAAAVLGVTALHAHHQQQLKASGGGKHASLSSASRLEMAGFLMTIGSLMFSGSIYLLCLEIGPKKILGPATPIGGLIMIGGWGLLGFCSMSTTESSIKSG